MARWLLRGEFDAHVQLVEDETDGPNTCYSELPITHNPLFISIESRHPPL